MRRALIATVFAVVLAIGAAASTARPIAASGAARPASAATSSPTGLASPREKEIAMELVSSAENSTLDWGSAYGYIEDIGDGRGYTAGLIGFCSGTGDMLALVRSYVAAEPEDPLARFVPALRRRAKDDGLGTLGQFIYFDAIVMHGPGASHGSFGWIRARATDRAATPAEGGSEVDYLNAFLDVRRALMKTEEKHGDISRIDDEQRVFLREGNLALRPPLVWHTYGDRYEIPAPGPPVAAGR
ncbi:MAG: chitosanase [Solirubrobacterales bacterium]